MQLIFKVKTYTEVVFFSFSSEKAQNSNRWLFNLSHWSASCLRTLATESFTIEWVNASQGSKLLVSNSFVWRFFMSVKTMKIILVYNVYSNKMWEIQYKQKLTRNIIMTTLYDIMIFRYSSCWYKIIVFVSFFLFFLSIY